MRVPQQLDYTLRALVALANLPGNATPAAGALALSAGLPKRFVEQQMTTLTKAGIVASRRGAGGGCTLARPAEAITVLDVVHAVQGAALDIPRTSGCAVSEMWGQAAETLEEYLASVTLADLAARQAEIGCGRSAMYYI